MDNPKQGGRVLAIPMASGAKVEPEAAAMAKQRWSEGGVEAERSQVEAAKAERRWSKGQIGPRMALE